MEKEDEVYPGKEHSHRPNLPLQLRWAQAVTRSEKHQNKANGGDVENKLKVVGQVKPVVEVQSWPAGKLAEPSPGAVAAAEVNVDELLYLQNKPNGRQEQRYPR